MKSKVAKAATNEDILKYKRDIISGTLNAVLKLIERCHKNGMDMMFLWEQVKILRDSYRLPEELISQTKKKISNKPVTMMEIQMKGRKE